jgi:hypothetical protein
VPLTPEEFEEQYDAAYMEIVRLREEEEREQKRMEQLGEEEAAARLDAVRQQYAAPFPKVNFAAAQQSHAGPGNGADAADDEAPRRAALPPPQSSPFVTHGLFASMLRLRQSISPIAALNQPHPRPRRASAGAQSDSDDAPLTDDEDD